MMIVVNLLPESARKPSASPLQQLPRSPLAVLLVGSLVAGWLSLMVIRQIHQIRLGRLNARMQALASKRTALDQLRASLKTLHEQQAVFQQLNRNRDRWASRLNVISDATPEGLWLTDLSVEPQNKLTLQGSAIARKGEEMVSLSRFVQDLKADPNFSRVLRDLHVDSIKNTQDGEIELMEFTLTGELVPSGAARTP